MTTATDELVQHWRSIGPLAWAESPHGWLLDDGQPIRFAGWQRAVHAAWWPRREDVSTLAVSKPKKIGGTTFNAIITGWRWLALPSLCLVAANDLDQSTSLVFAMIAEMVQRNPFLRNNVKVTARELIFEPTGSILRALPTDARGNAGAIFSTISYTEAWGIQLEQSVRAFEELTPIPQRACGFPCLRVVDSYSGFEGESETWHGICDRGLQGERVDPDWPIYLAGGLLLAHFTGEEAQRRCFLGTDAQRIAYYAEQKATLRENSFKRLHLNERTTNESQFISAEAWAACFDPTLRPIGVDDHRRMVIGVDGATTNDHAALVGVAYNRALDRVDVLHVREWTPKRGWLRQGKPTIDLAETVGAEVKRLHAANLIDAIILDPFQLHSLAIEWERLGIRVLEMPQTAARVEADQALYTAITSGRIAHYNDHILTEHIGNAIAKETVRGYRLDKQATSRKIDAAVSLSMAHHGALQMQKARGEVVVYESNPFYSDDVEPEDWVWQQIGQRMIKIPRDGATHHHELTREAMLACKRRMRGCGDCITFFEQDGEYERQQLEAAAKLQTGPTTYEQGRRYVPEEPPDRYREFMQKFNLKG